MVQDASGRSTHVDLDGRPLHDSWFLDLDVFHKGYARARDEAGWTHCDRRGRPAYARRFAAVEPFYNGQARVERFDGGLEVVDEAGETLVELRPALRSEFAALSGDLVGFWRTQAIRTAVSLGIFEGLPGTVDEVARAREIDPRGTYRLLRALGELSLVTRDGETWRTTPRGAYLRADHRFTLADAAEEYGLHFPRMWAALPEALRQGEAWPAPDIFGEVARDPDRAVSHHRMLRSYARHDYAAVPAALGLRGDEHVVDAGGGLGTLATLLVDNWPGLRVTLLDRPEVVAQARSAGLAERISPRATDLFAPWDIQADAVVMARVLHDWDDDRAQAAPGPRSPLPPRRWPGVPGGDGRRRGWRGRRAVRPAPSHGHRRSGADGQGVRRAPRGRRLPPRGGSPDPRPAFRDRGGGQMTAIDWRIPPSVLRWLDEVPASEPVVLLLRHSVRDTLPPGTPATCCPSPRSASGWRASSGCGWGLGSGASTRARLPAASRPRRPSPAAPARLSP